MEWSGREDCQPFIVSYCKFPSQHNVIKEKILQYFAYIACCFVHCNTECVLAEGFITVLRAHFLHYLLVVQAAVAVVCTKIKTTKRILCLKRGISSVDRFKL